MYNLFKRFWRQHTPMTLIEAFTRFRPLPKAPLGDLAAHLPREYVAAKFYASGALPDTPRNRAFIAATLADLTRTTDVVLLNTPDRYDEHADFAPARHDRLHTVEHLMTSETNLDVQSRIIGGATAFVGTYGGFSYLAPFLGVDTVSFFSHPAAFRFDHLELAKRVFSSFKHGAFVPLDVKDVDVIRLGVGGAGRPSSGRPGTDAAGAAVAGVSSEA
jgi:ADP-heptose:LPS heptosyltransferase